MEPVELSFGAVLKKYIKVAPRLWTWWEISLAFFIAIAVTGLVRIGYNALDVANSIAGTLFSSSTQLLGIVVAGFAISTAVLDPKFSKFVSKVGALEGLLFPFWFNTAQWVGAMVLSGILYIMTSVKGITVPLWLVQGTIFITVLWFSLTVSFLVSLVGSLFKLAIYRGAFEEVASSKAGSPGSAPKDDTKAK